MDMTKHYYNIFNSTTVLIDCQIVLIHCSRHDIHVLTTCHDYGHTFKGKTMNKNALKLGNNNGKILYEKASHKYGNT